MKYLFLLLLATSCNTGGSSSIEISNVWIMEPVPNSNVTAAYFEVKNRGSQDSIVSINSPIAGRSEIHSTIIDSSGNATMSRLDEVNLSKNDLLKFSPGGMHLMLIDLNRKIKVGEEYEINLKFKHSGSKKVIARVKSY